MKLELHSHLLCELFKEMLSLCGVERYSILCLPDFALVKFFCPLFSYRNQVFFIVGKISWKLVNNGFFYKRKEETNFSIYWLGQSK